MREAWWMIGGTSRTGTISVHLSASPAVVVGDGYLELLDAVRDAVLAVDAHGLIVFANRASHKMFGYARGGLVGRPVEVLVPPSGQDRHPALRRLFAASPVPRPMAGGTGLTAVRRDGTSFPAAVSLAPLETSSGRLVTAVVRDLTARQRQEESSRIQLELERRLRSSNERFRLAFDTAPVGMLMVSARSGHLGTVLKVNRALCELIGRSEGELLGHLSVDLFLPESPGGIAGVQQRAHREASSVDSVERRVVHADGRDIWVEISVVLVRDEAGEPDYFFVTQVIDITAKRQARREDRRRIERDHRIASVLQDALVPDVPRRLGPVDVAARYRPAGVGEAVGGDWLDVFPLPDGRIGVTVGDVAGHGIGSAATMSRLRYALRTLAGTGAGPAEVVTHLNRAMNLAELTSADIEIATLVHAQIDPTTGIMRSCNAGHPAPLAVVPGRGGPAVRWMSGADGPPIGVMPDAEYAEQVDRIPGGSLLIGYTDGLVERRAGNLSDGLQTLLDGLAALPAAVWADPEAVADAVLGAAPPGRREDDTAVIVLSFPRGWPVAARPGVRRPAHS